MKPASTPPGEAKESEPEEESGKALRWIGAAVALAETAWVTKIAIVPLTAREEWEWSALLDPFVLPHLLILALAVWLAAKGETPRNRDCVMLGAAGGCAFGCLGLLAGLLLSPWIGGQLGLAVCLFTAPLGFVLGVLFGLVAQPMDRWANR